MDVRRLTLYLLACFLVCSAGAPARAAAVRQSAGAHQPVAAEQAMTAYVDAIRYFNPGIDEPQARHIVVAIIRDAYDERIDPRLVVAIIATESSFDRTARSSAGAMGLGQLMPETAASDSVSDADDIDQNVRGTVLTLKGNLQHYAALDLQRRYVFAIAAYNAGVGAVDQYHGVPPYDETIHYVWKVVVLWRRLCGLSAT
jgi:soluble lytic murein transglycosylase-like protein